MSGQPSPPGHPSPPGQPSTPEPPRLARLLVSLGVHARDRAPVRADLRERFHRIVAEEGLRAARRWYWWQAVRGVGHRVTPDRELLRRRSWSGFWGDLRQRARLLARRPAYAIGVAGTLAIGLTSAIVVGTLAWNVWLAPMPFPDPDRVVRLFELEPPGPDPENGAEAVRWRLSPPLLEHARDRSWTTLEAVAGVSRNVLDWTRDEDARRISALTVSPEVFQVLGTVPLAGRLLSDDPDADEVVLEEGFWERAFGGDPAVVQGETMIFGGEPHQVVGVVRLPDAYPGSADVVVSFSWSREQLLPGMRGARYLDVVARVRPGFDVDEASAEMARFVAGQGREDGVYQDWAGDAEILSHELLRPYRGTFAVLLGAGLVFLFLAVVNVVGLVGARALEGRQERVIRVALGASRGRLLRGSLIESGLLALAAGAAGLALARWLLGPIVALAPAEVPRLGAVALDGWVVFAATLATVTVGMVVGVLAHLVMQTDSLPSRSGTSTPGQSLSRNALVACQVGLTTLLVCVGASLLRTVTSLQAVDLGFEPAGVASTSVMLAGDRYASPERQRVVWRDLLDGLAARGVDAAIGTNTPMAGMNMPWGHRVDPTEEQAFAQYHIVSSGYFDLMGIEVLEGRAFSPQDDERAAPVVIINDVLAEAEFGDRSPVGERIEVVAAEKVIVGVVAGTRHAGPDVEVPREIYAPFPQDPWPHAQLVVPGPSETAWPAVSAAAAAVDPGLGLAPLRPYDRFVRDWYASLRLQLLIVGVLAGVGLLLATLGLYALIAYRVSGMRREIGVRMALGASRSSVFSRLLRQGMVVVGVGLSAGLGVWYLTAPRAEGWLGGLNLTDPWIPLAVLVFVAATSAAAVGIPARRSLSVDPTTALREE